jgi:hypothetical protein
MKTVAKLIAAAALLTGVAINATPAAAQTSFGFSFGYGPYYGGGAPYYGGGYGYGYRPYRPYRPIANPCFLAPYARPAYCGYPVYGGPIFIGGVWHNGPFHYRMNRGYREFWWRNRWYRGRW